MAKIDPNVLKEFAETERQAVVCQAVIENGSNTKAADKAQHEAEAGRYA